MKLRLSNGKLNLGNFVKNINNVKLCKEPYKREIKSEKWLHRIWTCSSERKKKSLIK